MFGRYRKREVEQLVRRLRGEYEELLAARRREEDALKEENRDLAARLSQLEAERENVASALLHAVEEGERIKAEGARAAENDRREAALLAEKCRLYLEKLQQKYPDEEDTRSFAAFVDSLTKEDDGSGVLDMDEVLAPKHPLDLKKLCIDLGLTEDGE